LIQQQLKKKVRIKIMYYQKNKITIKNKINRMNVKLKKLRFLTLNRQQSMKTAEIVLIIMKNKIQLNPDKYLIPQFFCWNKLINIIIFLCFSQLIIMIIMRIVYTLSNNKMAKIKFKIYFMNKIIFGNY